jgi:hypothetical protein
MSAVQPKNAFKRAFDANNPKIGDMRKIEDGKREFGEEGPQNGNFPQ